MRFMYRLTAIDFNGNPYTRQLGEGHFHNTNALKLYQRKADEEGVRYVVLMKITFDDDGRETHEVVNEYVRSIAELAHKLGWRRS